PAGAREPVGLAGAVNRLAGNCGLSAARRRDVINQLLAATRDFLTRVEQLETLPDENKARLLDRVRDVRSKLA
ncbi:MAG: hypothetical protein R3308_06135, partial [Thiohalobacterales bacterium]|nr:hypothetical protein [Thiohalobacterales bacterium]